MANAATIRSRVLDHQSMQDPTTVELFCGIGGFRLAADRCGLTTVWANDIDPKACRVYRNQFGDDVLHEGDIRQLKSEVPPHDILTGGFPCQPFSNAGKKQGTRDPRGTLFQEIVDVLRFRQPRYFVLENVKRLLSMEAGQHFATILDSLAALNYRIEWRLLNAMHLDLPQNRQRVFVCGTRTDVAADLRTVALATPQDLSELSDGDLSLMHRPESWPLIEDHGKSFVNWGLAEDRRFFAADLPSFSAAAPTPLLKSVLETNVDAGFDFTDSTIERLKNSTPVHRFVDGVEILSNQGGGARMGYTVFGVNGVAPTLTATPSRHYERYQINGRFRRLTNVEYARIQGYPDDHCAGISVYDQYGLFGNAVPPAMAFWVLRHVLSPISLREVSSKDPQLSLLAQLGDERDDDAGTATNPRPGQPDSRC